MFQPIRLPLLLVIGVVMGGKRPGKRFGTSSGFSSADDPPPPWTENGVCYDRPSYEGVSVLGCGAGKNLQATMKEQAALIASLQERLDNLPQPAPVPTVTLYEPPSDFVSLCKVTYPHTACIPLLTFVKGMPPAVTVNTENDQASATAFASAYCQQLGYTSAQGKWTDSYGFDFIGFGEFTFFAVDCVLYPGSNFATLIACLKKTGYYDWTFALAIKCQ